MKLSFVTIILNFLFRKILGLNVVLNDKLKIDLKETKSAKIFKQRVINIYLENYERYKCGKPSCLSCE